MRRYYFNVQDSRAISDTVRTILGDADAARVEAVAVLGELIKDGPETFWKSTDWQMHVTDEQDASVCNLRFSGTVGAH